ncbi:MAG: Asp-tRNA(Asn)/Glu-tRNA(Gln) amidotransferase subunit GatC [Minisyncoccia bacterium]
MISKKDLEKLAGLARMDLKKDEEGKLLKDLSKILDYFEELKGVDTENIPPLSGGTQMENVFRDDGSEPVLGKEKAVAEFPEESGGFLKVPPVF